MSMEVNYIVVVKVTQSCLFVTPWTIQSMEFSSPEYWSGKLFLSPGDLPNPEIEPKSPALQVDSQLSHKGSPSNIEALIMPLC